jgi:hypothetical protein
MLLLTASVSGLFKWRQSEPKVILLAVGWYLRFSLSYVVAMRLREKVNESFPLPYHNAISRPFSSTNV